MNGYYETQQWAHVSLVSHGTRMGHWDILLWNGGTYQPNWRI